MGKRQATLEQRMETESKIIISLVSGTHLTAVQDASL
jgi:hypothetical protein